MVSFLCIAHRKTVNFNFDVFYSFMVLFSILIVIEERCWELFKLELFPVVCRCSTSVVIKKLLNWLNHWIYCSPRNNRIRISTETPSAIAVSWNCSGEVLIFYWGYCVPLFWRSKVLKLLKYRRLTHFVQLKINSFNKIPSNRARDAGGIEKCYSIAAFLLFES